MLQLGGGLGDEGDDEAEDDLSDPETVDTLSRMVPEAVLALHAHFRVAP
ncbi:MAG: hypothetical protein U5L74_05275 [Ideonella sp.]|nr:hypothetical protein [Ideonella sp.]